MFSFFKNTNLTEAQISILENEFVFYQRLNQDDKIKFQKRVANYLHTLKFISREGFIITDQVTILILATLVMLTFGYKKVNLKSVESILVYPDTFYSTINNQYHKGEFNPKLKALVISWKDFLEGYKIENDNLNLGIHECIHAIHFNAIKYKGTNLEQFVNGLSALIEYVDTNADIKEKLITLPYIREYAFTNQFEFIAVLVETFIETPEHFKAHFPEIYKHIKVMLNFNFANY